MIVLKLIKRDRYYLLLAVQIVFIFTLPFLEKNSWFEGLFQAAGLSAILLAGSNILKGSIWKKGLGIALAVGFIALTMLSRFEQFPSFYAGTFILFFILNLAVLWEIISMLIFSDEIKMSFIAGAISGYLLMAICLTFFCITVALYDPNILSKSISDIHLQGVLYYSLITMTTIGYGDISPVNPLVQTASAMAGVASQFYMAVVVAVIVGKLMNKKA